MRSRRKWIIDFGEMSDKEAALFEAPFEYLRVHVKKQRDEVRNPLKRSRWWQHGRVARDMRSAVNGLSRFIATPRHSKHRMFTRVAPHVIPDSALVVFARDDDYFVGVLHSQIHELWARRIGMQVRDAESGFRYTPVVCFDQFTFPYAPGSEPTEADSHLVRAIADAARELVRLRDAWLNPPNASEDDLKTRTLTKLYNTRPEWLANAHRTLDEAVLPPMAGPPPSPTRKSSHTSSPSTMSASELQSQTRRLARLPEVQHEKFTQFPISMNLVSASQSGVIGNYDSTRYTKPSHSLTHDRPCPVTSEKRVCGDRS